MNLAPEEMRPAWSAATRRRVTAIALGAALLAVLLALRIGPVIGTDGVEIVAIGRTLAEHGRYAMSVDDPELFVRSPGLPLLVTATVWITGHPSILAIRLIIALLYGLGIFCAGRLAARVSSWPAAPIAAAIATAVIPEALRSVKTILPEGLALPLLVLWTDLLIASDDRERWVRSVCALGLLGGVLALTRYDLLATLLPALVFRAVGNWRRSRAIVFSLRNFVASTALIGLVCAPWSAFASMHLSQPVLVARGLPNPEYTLSIGFGRWLASTAIRPSRWEPGRAALHGYPDECDLPPGVRVDDPERSQALELLERCCRKQLSVADTSMAFDRLTQKHRSEHPFQSYFGVPLLRGVLLWIDLPRRHFAPEASESVRRYFGPLWTALDGVFAIAFVLCLYELFTGRGRAWMIAAIVLVRTFSLSFGGVLGGNPLAEFRYVSCVVPEALLVGVVHLGRLRPQRLAKQTSR